jgi:hypothetical protein
MGFVFLWAFLDKTFGLHYATPSAEGVDTRPITDERVSHLG